MPIYGPQLSGGVSTLGNTGGTTGMAHDQIVFIGSNNITLSQSQSGNSATVSIYGGAGGGGTGYLSAGTTIGSLGTISFANSNNVSFGMNGQTMTASVSPGGAGDGVNILAAGTQTANTTGTVLFQNSNGLTFGMSNSSIITGSYTVPSIAGLISAINVSGGTTSNNLSAITFANSNGVSFGLNGSVMTGSHNALTSQSNQAISFTSGSVTFQTLSFTNSNGISFNSGTQGIFASHNALTTAALSDHSHGNPTLALTNLTGTTASASNGLTISLSAAAPGAAGEKTISYWDNAGINSATNALAGKVNQNGTLMIFPMDVADRHFPGRITGNSVYLNLSLSASTATISAAHTTFVSLGIYTRNANTLSLLNSVSTSWGNVAATNNSTIANGIRFLSFHSSQWSSQPVFSEGIVYYAGLWLRSSGSSAATFSVLGHYAYMTASRSGTVGVNSASATSLGFSPWFGIYATSTSGALPAAIQSNQINKQTASANFQPHLIINNYTNVF